MRTAKPRIEMEVQMDANPGPLPLEREHRSPRPDETGVASVSAALTGSGPRVDEGKVGQECSKSVPGASFSLGERAGVRASLCLLSLLLLSMSAHAQSYSIDWFKIAAGGGTSTGGVYSVSGTIGQPDAGTLSGGSYTLAGGFWGIISAVQTPGAPLLSVERIGSAVRVFWPKPSTGFVLDQSLTVTGAWSQVSFPYATNTTDISITVSAPAGNRFYRLRFP